MDALAASEFQKLVADAIALHKSGRLDEAERSYRAALRMTPGHGAITHNLGVLAAAQGKHAAAISHFDAAIAAEPRYASAHYNRAAALEASGRTHDAIQGYSRACAIEPEHYGSHRALGFLWLAQGERGRALDHFARTYELRRGEDRSGIAAASLTSANRGKLLHDADQFRYLAGRRRDGQRFELMARAYEQVAAGVPAEAAPLSPSQREILGEDYNTAINIYSAPEMRGRRRERAPRPRRAHRALPGATQRRDLFRRPAHGARARHVAALSAREHDLARLQSHRRLRRVLSRGRPGLPAAAADRRRASRHVSGAARPASPDPGLGVQGARSGGGGRRARRRCRGQREFLGHAR